MQTTRCLKKSNICALRRDMVEWGSCRKPKVMYLFNDWQEHAYNMLRETLPGMGLHNYTTPRWSGRCAGPAQIFCSACIG